MEFKLDLINVTKDGGIGACGTLFVLLINKRLNKITDCLFLREPKSRSMTRTTAQGVKRLVNAPSVARDSAPRDSYASQHQPTSCCGKAPRIRNGEGSVKYVAGARLQVETGSPGGP